MIGIEGGLIGLGVIAGMVLWHLCVLRNRAAIWGWLEVYCCAKRYAAIEFTRIRALGVDSAGERHVVDCVGRRG